MARGPERKFKSKEEFDKYVLNKYKDGVIPSTGEAKTLRAHAVRFYENFSEMRRALGMEYKKSYPRQRKKEEIPLEEKQKMRQIFTGEGGPRLYGDAFEQQVQLGDILRVSYKNTGWSDERTLQGKVIGIYERHFVMQCGKYRTSFLHIDFKTGEKKLEFIRRARRSA